MLHFEGDVASVSFNISTAELTGGHLAIFTEHDPSEFAVDGNNPFKMAGKAGLVDVEAAFTVGAQNCPPPAPLAPPHQAVVASTLAVLYQKLEQARFSVLRHAHTMHTPYARTTRTPRAHHAHTTRTPTFAMPGKPGAAGYHYH